MFRGCREPSGNRQTALPSLLVALPLSTLPVLRLPPELPASLSDTEGETEGEGVPSLGSTESEMWLGKLMMMTKEEGMSWPRGGDEAEPLDNNPRRWVSGGAGVDPFDRHGHT